MATLPARRPATTCPQQRLAEIYGLSDSEDEDLYPADQPDLPYTTPGAPRIKFAVVRPTLKFNILLIIQVSRMDSCAI